MSNKEKAAEFLKSAHKFHLGELTTEKPHPLTENLSNLVKSDLLEALACLKQVDIKALQQFSSYLKDLKPMHDDIRATLNSGGRIFLCGCGATGRLSLSLEALWREVHPGSDQVVGFMAGGDVALVHAIEGFEDYPDFGARQLEELHFAENDLLISCTEGGETPFVIGATWKAAEISQRKPYFLYCNLDATLSKYVERSREIIESDQVHTLSVFVGPMAITGSTRMQASTVLQLAVGLSLFYDHEERLEKFNHFLQFVNKFNFSPSIEFVKFESETYLQHQYVHYWVDSYALTVFTDTTERAPTFNLQAFNHLEVGVPQSLAFVSLVGAHTAEESWQGILHRPPRALGWDNNEHLSEKYLLGFDFSQHAFAKRLEILPKDVQSFEILQSDKGISWQLGDLHWEMQTGELDLLFRHLLLKMAINNHSTLVMGCMDRFYKNLMTWVYPSNGKLIDRAARYVSLLLKADDNEKTYEEIVGTLFSEFENLQASQSLVLETYKRLS